MLPFAIPEKRQLADNRNAPAGDTAIRSRCGRCIAKLPGGTDGSPRLGLPPFGEDVNGQFACGTYGGAAATGVMPQDAK